MYVFVNLVGWRNVISTTKRLCNDTTLWYAGDMHCTTTPRVAFAFDHWRRSIRSLMVCQWCTLMGFGDSESCVGHCSREQTSRVGHVVRRQVNRYKHTETKSLKLLNTVDFCLIDVDCGWTNEYQTLPAKSLEWLVHQSIELNMGVSCPVAPATSIRPIRQPVVTCYVL